MEPITTEGRPWQPLQPSHALDVQVLAILQDGRVHHRLPLARELGATLREVRASVSRLRQLGWPVGWAEAGGYRLSWTQPVVDGLLRQYRHQAIAHVRVYRRLRRLLDRRDPTAGACP